MMTIEEALSETWNTLSEIVEKNLSSSVNFLETIGKCPKCGEDVNEENIFYKCSSCGFKLWKKARHFESNFSINTEQAKQFLNNEEVLCELVDKDNKKTKKNLKLYLNGEYVNFEETKETIGKCPKCGADIVEGESNFYCSDYKKGCTFKLWKNAKHFKDTLKITKAVAKQLLKKDGKSTCLLYTSPSPRDTR